MKTKQLYCIDIGNTMLEIAKLKNGEVFYKKHISTQSIKDDIKTFKLLLEDSFIEELKQVESSAIISSVVPEVNTMLKELLMSVGFKKVIFVKELKLPLKCNFETTGADIIAKSLYLDIVKEKHAIILDVGTATVMQYVNNKSIEKVAITIGFGTIYSALHGKTSLLPLIKPTRVENILQENTVASMQAGTYWGYIGLLNMFIEKAKQELYPNTPKVFLTGGLSKLLVKDLKFDFYHDPDIIFKSLDYIYNLALEENRF